MGGSPARPGSFAVGDPSLGPGQYGGDGLIFASDVNGFTIGELRSQN